MGKGWIKVHRKITNNDLWIGEPFTKGQAWIDLLLLADGVDSDGYEAGKVYKSVLFLSNRWKWSRSKTRRFLDYLEGQQMIQQMSQQNGHILTIENWDFYQGKRPTKEPTNRPTNVPYKRRKEYIEEEECQSNDCTLLIEEDDDEGYDPRELWRMLHPDEGDL